MKGAGLTREKVLATVVRLLETTLIRVGKEFEKFETTAEAKANLQAAIEALVSRSLATKWYRR